MSNFRSHRLKDLANQVPHCMYCKAPNHGQVVLAHSNQLRHGHGLSVKAHDIPCYLCFDCHSKVDGRFNATLAMGERMNIFNEGIYQSILWLLQTGRITIGCES
jgi:5-methylcytosine-specific restriction endonuclease McrA